MSWERQTLDHCKGTLINKTNNSKLQHFEVFQNPHFGMACIAVVSGPRHKSEKKKKNRREGGVRKVSSLSCPLPLLFVFVTFIFGWLPTTLLMNAKMINEIV